MGEYVEPDVDMLPSNESQGTVFPVANSSFSYWRSDLHPLDKARSTPDLPSDCDIAIVGAGMSGVAVAYHTLKAYGDGPKPSITILDARELCSGATGRNGGHVKNKVDSILNYKKKNGRAAAEEYAIFGVKHIHAIKEVVERESLDCEFELRRTYDLFLDPGEGQKIQEQYLESLRNGEIWTRDISMVPEKHVEEITSIKGAKVAFTGPACSLWPYKFVSQLLSRIADQVNIQMQTPVTEVTEDVDSGRQVLHTSRGQVRAKKVVFATNGYTNGLLPRYKDKIIPTRGHASHLIRDPTFVAPHLANTYNLSYPAKGTDYLNPRPDGGIVVGGAKWTYEKDLSSWQNVWDDSEVLTQPREHFDQLMPRYFRGWEASGAYLERLWSGIMGYTSDEVPFIGHVPGAKGKQYIIAGFNGGGMSMIFLSALGLSRIIKDDIPFTETGIPALFESTEERISRR